MLRHCSVNQMKLSCVPVTCPPSLLDVETPSLVVRLRCESPGVGNLSIKKLRCALEAAGQGASGSPRHTFLRARGTKKHRRRDRTTAPILIGSRVPAPAG